jgi:hypothetical protein
MKDNTVTLQLLYQYVMPICSVTPGKGRSILTFPNAKNTFCPVCTQIPVLKNNGEKS